MSEVHSFKDLKVWQKARALNLVLYKLTAQFPKEEIYGLTSQMRRASVSIVSNIAEGSAKRSTKEFLRFLSIAYGSLCELEAQIILCEDLGYHTGSDMESLQVLLHEVGKMLNGLMNSLERKLNSEL